MPGPLQQVLAQLNPRRIAIDPALVRPSVWDKQAVAKDLDEYVGLSRTIKATPTVRVVEGALKLISGEPFLRAVLAANPLMEQIVCLVEGYPEEFHSLGIEELNPTTLLDSLRPDEIYEAVEMLTFIRPLTDGEVELIKGSVMAFVHDRNARPSPNSDTYWSVSPFKWESQHNRLIWTWKRNDQTDSLLLFLRVLHDINRTVAGLTSWNGMSFENFTLV